MHNLYFFRWDIIMAHYLMLCEIADCHYLICLVHPFPFKVINMLVYMMVACPVKFCCMDMQDQWPVFLFLCPYSGSECHPVMAMDYVKILLFCNFFCRKREPVNLVMQCRAVYFCLVR